MTLYSIVFLVIGILLVVVSLVVLMIKFFCFLIRRAVKDGVIDAYKYLDNEKKHRQDLDD